VLIQPAQQKHDVSIPHRWEDLPMGDWLACQIQARLDVWCPQLYGYHLLKLGCLSGTFNCFSSPIYHQVTATAELGLGGIVMDPTELSFQENCINACILTQCLDFSADPHQVLREVERVLTADGYLILSGYNPLSLCGLTKMCGLKRNVAPWSARMFTPARIKDWLSLLGFEIIQDDRFAFTSFLGKKPMSWWTEGIGQMHFPSFSSVYFIVARKRRIPISPVKNWWKLSHKARKFMPSNTTIKLSGKLPAQLSTKSMRGQD